MFKMGRWHCYFFMLIHQALSVGIIYLLVAAALATAGFIHSVWAGIAALSVDGFLAVMVMSFVIMAYGFNSVTGINITPHSFELDGHRLVVRYEDGKTTEINISDIKPYTIYPGGVIVPVENDRKGWLWITPGAFENPDEMLPFLKALYPADSQGDTTAPEKLKPLKQ